MKIDAAKNGRRINSEFLVRLNFWFDTSAQGGAVVATPRSKSTSTVWTSLSASCAAFEHKRAAQLLAPRLLMPQQDNEFLSLVTNGEDPLRSSGVSLWHHPRRFQGH
ncbi:hypothetical protein HFO86_34665 [Rhizobium leguminosarum]|nr:hypothetical protein [Rhizobium leguminosarum]